MLPAIPARLATGALQSLTLLALPHGGQRTARRNAWASMSADSALARTRREAAGAMSLAVALPPAVLQVAMGD
jgi:hypothetical protein